MAEGKSEILELIVKLNDALTGPLKNLTKHTKEFEEQLEKTEHTAEKMEHLAIAGGVFLGMAYAVKEGLEHMVEPAIEFQHVQNELQRATGASAKQLEEFAEQAHHIAATIPVSAEEVTQAQATLTRMLGGTEEAMATMETTAQFANATNMKAADAAMVLSSAYQNLGDRSKPLKQGFVEVADVLALLQNRSGRGAEGATEMAKSLAHVAGAAQVYRVSLNEAAALTDAFGKMGLAGGRGAGPMVEETIAALGKLDKHGSPILRGLYAKNAMGGLDVAGTLENLASAPQAQVSFLLKSMGAAGESIKLLMRHTEELTASEKAFANAAGQAALLSALASQDPAKRFQMFHQVVEQLEESIGSALLPLLVDLAQTLTPVFEGFAHFAEAHQTLVKVTVIIAAVVGGMLAVSGAISLVVAGYVQLKSTVLLASAAFKVARAAMLAFDAAMLLNPIGLIIAGVAALAVAGYEVYEHWTAVKQFFTEGWGRFTGLGMLITTIEALWDWLPKVYDWGVHLIDNIVKGIKAGIGKVAEVMSHVRQVIRSYIPFSGATQNIATVNNATRATATSGMIRTAAFATAAMVPMMAPAMQALAPPLAAPAGNGGDTHVNLTFNTGPGTSADDLEKVAQDHILPAVEAAMREAERNRSRRGFK